MKNAGFIFLFFLICISYSNTIAQAPAIQWKKSLGGTNYEWGRAIILTSDGGYITTGPSFSNDGNASGNHGNGDYWVTKLDNQGNIQWQRSYGGSEYDWANDIIQTIDGGYIVVGFTRSDDGDVVGRHTGTQGGFPSTDMWVIKLSSTGVLQWQRCYGGSLDDKASTIEATTDGGYIIGGSTCSNNNGDVSGYHMWVADFQSPDYWVVKINSTGAIQWQKAYGGSYSETGSCIKQTTDGGYIIGGTAVSTDTQDGDISGCHTSSTEWSKDIWLVKLDNAGNLQWQRCYGSFGHEYFGSLTQTPDGGYIFTGSAGADGADVSGVHSSWTSDVWVGKINSSGGIQWQRCFGGTKQDMGDQVENTADGGYIVTAHVQSSDGDLTSNYGGDDYWLIKLNSSGNIEWQKNYGGSLEDKPYEIKQTLDGYFIVTGISLSPDHDISGSHGGGDFWVVKLGPSCLSSMDVTSSLSSICAGANVTFTSTITNPSSNPSYQWQLNGVIVGSNSSTYTTSTLSDNDTLVCIVNTDANCAVNPSSISDTVFITVNNSVTPTLTISPNTNNICSGNSVTFTATGINGGSAPSFQWTKNGINVGTNSSSYVDNGLVNGDQIRCSLTSNYPCVTAATALSNTVIMNVTASATPSITISTANNTICSGANVNFTSVAVNAGATPSYQWKKNGINVGTNSPSYFDNAINNGDQVQCVLTSNYPCVTAATASANLITITVSSSLTPSVAISTATTTICAVTNTSFTANAINGGTSPAFQWIKNGINVGTNSATYLDNNLNNGDQVKCILTSDLSCVTTSTAQSNTITITVQPVLAPSITITASSNNVCSGTNVTFTANILNGGSTPTFQWTKNSVNVGANNNVYSDNSLNNGDQVKCIITSDYPCASPTNAQSNTVVMNVTQSVPSSVSVSASSNNICPATNVVFTATAINGGSSPGFQWVKNGVNVGTNSATYSDNSLNNGDQVKCILGSNYVCAAPAIAESNTIVMVVTTPPNPQISISANGNDICTGSSVAFTASLVNGGSSISYQWFKNGIAVGTSTALYTDNALNNNDLVSCTLTTVNACGITVSAQSNVITLIVKPILIAALTIETDETVICPGKTISFTASAVNGGSSPLYQWKKNGVNIGNNSDVLAISNLASGDVVSCTLTSNIPCAVSPANSNNIVITVTNIPVQVTLGPDTTICTDKRTPVELKVSPAFNFLTWQDGSTVSTFTVTAPGQYYVTVRNEEGCTGTDTINVKSKECIKGFYVPNAFTPNNGQQNNLFKPLIFGRVGKYEFTIYNRWGNTVFRTNDPNRGWDGTVKGQMQDTQTFTWLCTYQLDNAPIKTVKGYVMLIK